MQSDLYVYELLHVRNQKPTCNLDTYMHRLNISFVEIRVMSAEGPQHQVSIDEIFDSFQEIDVDASGKVSKRELERYLAGGDIQHTFVVVFKTADIGITWVDGANGSVLFSALFLCYSHEGKRF
mmetsp:Transcript_17077/g.50097  ORF Transcript_17077/g.50097 Transcript_17077/m.50097 type:complete len:124 (+) Transcript_17077:2001-2372(+)